MTRSASLRLLSQIGVATEPGLDQRDLHAGAVQLDAQRVADRLDRVLGGGVGRREGHRDAPADRGDEHDPAARAPQRRQHRLGDGDLAEAR